MPSASKASIHLWRGVFLLWLGGRKSALCDDLSRHADRKVRRDVVQTRKDRIGFAQFINRIGRCKSEDAHARSLGRADTCERILDYQTVRRSDCARGGADCIEALAGEAIDRRIRFSDRTVFGRNDQLKILFDEGSSECGVDLLSAATGCDGQPIGGLGGLHKLNDTREEGRFVGGGTCMKQIRLPVHDSLKGTVVADSIACSDQHFRAGAFVHPEIDPVVLFLREEQALFCQRLLKTQHMRSLVVGDDSIENRIESLESSVRSSLFSTHCTELRRKRQAA